MFKWNQQATNISIMTALKNENRKLIQDHEVSMNEMRATSQQFARENNDALVRISSEKQEEIEFLIKKHHEEKREPFAMLKKSMLTLKKNILPQQNF